MVILKTSRCVIARQSMLLKVTYLSDTIEAGDLQRACAA